jgi:hypothetical protein
MFPMIGEALTDDRRRQISRVVRGAFRHNNQTMDNAALEAERDGRQFARQCDGFEGSLTSFMKQPKGFWQWLAVGLLEEFGIPPELERVAQLHRIVSGRKRMAHVAESPKRDVG